MKWTGFILFLLIGLGSSGQVSDQIRLAYRDATESKEKAETLYSLLQHVQQSDQAELVAYKGAAKTLLARYERLTERGSKVRDGVEWIEQGIKKAPQNIEIRLIRLSVQENLPKLLKYHQNIEEDRALIKSAYPNLEDEGLKKMIQAYFKDFN